MSLYHLYSLTPAQPFDEQTVYPLIQLLKKWRERMGVEPTEDTINAPQRS